MKTHRVDVSWTCKGFTKSGAGTDELKSPPDFIEGDTLKRLGPPTKTSVFKSYPTLSVPPYKNKCV